MQDHVGAGIYCQRPHPKALADKNDDKDEENEKETDINVDRLFRVVPTRVRRHGDSLSRRTFLVVMLALPMDALRVLLYGPAYGPPKRGL